MTDVVYTTVPGKIGSLLTKIRSVGVPTKVTNGWLKTIGFTSSNDGSLIGVLKVVNLIDQSGVPTPTWSQYRGANHKEILGQAIRDGYSELYAVYPNAHEHPNIDLENVFSTSTKGGKQVISKIVSTFRGLADQATFDATDAENLNIKADALHVPVGQAPSKSAAAPTGAPRPSLHIDLQVHISPDSTPEQIEQIFASMAKHLYGE
jgi:Family of unknown function (DUF5343)